VTNSTHYETYRCRKLTSSLETKPNAHAQQQQLHPLPHPPREVGERRQQQQEREDLPRWVGGRIVEPDERPKWMFCQKRTGHAKQLDWSFAWLLWFTVPVYADLNHTVIIASYLHISFWIITMTNALKLFCSMMPAVVVSEIIDCKVGPSSILSGV